MAVIASTRVLAAIAALALAAVLAASLLGGGSSGSGDGVPSLQVQAAARNVSRDEERFAAKVAGAAAGDRIEYSLTAVNSGAATLSDVVLAFTPPPTWGATLVRGSCTLRRPGADAATCSDRLDGQDLSAGRLGKGERLEARVTYTLDPPPCRTASVPSETTSDSRQTPATNVAVATVAYRGLSGRLPRCGTKLAQLLAAVPGPTRATCREWPGFDAPILGRVSCLPKQGVQYAVYILYRTPAIAGQAYQLIADDDRPRACGSFTDGRGSVQDGDGKRVFSCSTSAAGQAHLTWYDDAASVFGYAEAADDNRDRLLAWWRAKG